MQRWLVASLSSLLLAGTAAAADLPSYDPAPMPMAAASAYQWTGFYAGLHGAFATGDLTGDYDIAPFGAYTALPSLDIDGWQAGLHLGYDWQWNWAVIGVRGDLAWSDYEASTTVLGVRGVWETNWTASLTGRLGVAVDRFHPYLLGGVTFLDSESTARNAAFSAKADASYTGLTLGAGLEAALTENVSLFGEYRHTWFEETKMNIGAPFTSRVKLQPELDTFMVGVSYRFGG
ncbi:outer membrane protein [Afifella pfennigii]|uniref:outer membrane protein n=1 Tax=Afifella pfennigii TaxID=209897 RepID=UPI000479A296|nr:outer membrane beta-barrel protein [Afifella pfennigii]